MSIVIRSTKALIARNPTFSEARFVQGAIASLICLVVVAITPISRVVIEGTQMQDHPAAGMALIAAVLLGVWGRHQVKRELSQRRRFEEPAARHILGWVQWVIARRGSVLALNLVALLGALIARPEGEAAGVAYLLNAIISSLYFVCLVLMLFLDDLALLFIGSRHLPAAWGYPGSPFLGAAGSYGISLLAVGFLLLFIGDPANPTVGLLTLLAIPMLSIGRHFIIAHLTSRGGSSESMIAAAQIGAVISMIALTMILISTVLFAVLIISGDNRVAAAGMVYGLIVLLISEGQGQIFRHVRRAAQAESAIS